MDREFGLTFVPLKWWWWGSVVITKLYDIKNEDR